MSDRFKRITTQYDDRTFLIGRVARLPDKRLEYDAFHVVTYMGGIEYDVTKALSAEQVAHFKQAYELELENKHMDALSTVSDAVYDWDHEEGA